MVLCVAGRTFHNPTVKPLSSLSLCPAAAAVPVLGVDEPSGVLLLLLLCIVYAERDDGFPAAAVAAPARKPRVLVAAERMFAAILGLC